MNIIHQTLRFYDQNPVISSATMFLASSAIRVCGIAIHCEGVEKLGLLLSIPTALLTVSSVLKKILEQRYAGPLEA